MSLSLYLIVNRAAILFSCQPYIESAIALSDYAIQCYRMITFTRFCGSCCVCANCDGGISTDWVSVGSTCDVVCEDKVMLQPCRTDEKQSPPPPNPVYDEVSHGREDQGLHIQLNTNEAYAHGH